MAQIEALGPLRAATFSEAQWAALQRARALTAPAGAGPAGPTPAGSDVSALRESGVLAEQGGLDPDWAWALRVVDEARVEVLALTGLLGQFALARYHLGQGAGRDWMVAAVADENGNRHVSFPHAWATIARQLADLLGAATPPVEAPFEAELGLVAFAALAGMVDAVRMQQLHSTLQRDAFSVFPVRAIVVQEMVAQGQELPDHRWWASLCQRLAPLPLPSAPEAVGVGLDELVGQGLLARQDAGFVPLERGRLLIDSLLAPLAVAAVGFMQHEAGRLLSLDHVAAVRTATLFWAFNFRLSPTPRVDLKSTRAADFCDYLERLVQAYEAAAVHGQGAG